MSRNFIVALALALTSIALPAAAHDGEAEHAKFPMAAAEFSQHVDTRIEKWRAKLEHSLAERNVPPDQAQAARARFEQGTVIVKAEVAKATADGVVTEDEAHHVREVARAMHPHHHEHG